MKIGTEPTARHRLQQIPAGCAEEAHVHLDRPRRAERKDLPLLQHAQQGHLRLRRQLADLVEEQRPSLRAPDQPRAILLRAGEGPLAVTEELGGDQVRWYRPAVEGDESPGASGEPVDRPRQQLLSRPALADDGHVDRALGDGAHPVEFRHERRDQRRHSGDGPVERLVQRLRGDRDRPAEEEESAPHLDQIAVREQARGAPLPVHQGAVLRPGIGQLPPAASAAELGVNGRHRGVRDADVEAG